MPTGACGIIPSLEDWRIDHLKKHNIDFSRAFAVNFELGDHNDKRALFKSGVLCADKQDKGPVLLAFLEKIRYKPSRIIFIDNKLEYLKSVEEALQETKIEFTGFHYTAVEDRPCIVDEKLAEFQLLHLIQTDRWLTHQEARAMLSN